MTTMETGKWKLENGRPQSFALRQRDFPISSFYFPLLCLLFVSILCARPQGGAEADSVEALMEAGHWKRARAIVEPRAAHDARDARAACQLARVKLAFGDLDGALEAARRAVALEDGNSSYHYQLAAVYEEMAAKASIFTAAGYAVKLKLELEAALKRDPGNRDALDDLMLYSFEAPGVLGGDKEKARALAAKLAQLDQLRGRLAQAELAEAAKDFGKQEEWLLQAVQTDPKNYEAQTTLAGFYAQAVHRKLQGAGQHARQAVQLDSSRAKGYRILAGVLALEQRWGELEATLAAAQENVPDDLAPYFQAANAILDSGVELKRGESYARTYLAQQPEGEEPDAAHAHRLLGLILEKEGRKREAAAELETALSINPRFLQAKDDLRRLQK